MLLCCCFFFFGGGGGGESNSCQNSMYMTLTDKKLSTGNLKVEISLSHFDLIIYWKETVLL